MNAAAEVPNSNRQLAFFDLPNVATLSRLQKVNVIKKANLQRRNQKIKMRFDHLYNVDRKRLDDVIAILAEEFALAKSTIESALRSE